MKKMKNNEFIDLESRKKTLKLIRFIFIGLFVILIINLVYFMLFSRDNLVINSYNPRLEELEANIIKGKILDRNGEVLAESIETDSASERVYPYENIFAHVIGYSHQGKTGIEALADIDMLRCNMSITQKIYYDLTNKKKLGDNIVTTLDLKLQQKAYELLGDYKGAIVAIEPSTGKILCMVSKPDFNPNEISLEWEGLIGDEDNSPLLNRATQGVYPPGSTFKILTALEYITEYSNTTDFNYYCEGEDTFEDKVIHCYNSYAHGEEDLKQAFANSCNTGFATIGEMIDITKFGVLANKLLFNQALPYDLPCSTSSFTLTSEDSRALRAETVIGQGETMITPLHNALIVAAIANGGIMMQPYLIDQIENNEGKVVDKNMPKILDEVIDPELTTTITDYMIEVINNGTGSAAASDYQIAAKTGSAENPFGDTHAWFVGFAPAENPQIAIAIIIENAGGSSYTSVPMAKELLDLYLH